MNRLTDKDYKGEELKPCPFCDSSDLTILSEDWGHMVLCENCHAQGPSAGEKEDAVKYWNERKERLLQGT